MTNVLAEAINDVAQRGGGLISMSFTWVDDLDAMMKRHAAGDKDATLGVCLFAGAIKMERKHGPRICLVCREDTPLKRAALVVSIHPPDYDHGAVTLVVCRKCVRCETEIQKSAAVTVISEHLSEAHGNLRQLKNIHPEVGHA